jgi:hypothetical protein
VQPHPLRPAGTTAATVGQAPPDTGVAGATQVVGQAPPDTGVAGANVRHSLTYGLCGDGPIDSVAVCHWLCQCGVPVDVPSDFE